MSGVAPSKVHYPAYSGRGLENLGQLGMTTENNPSVGGDLENGHALTITYLYPRWEPERRSYSLDVLGYGLATDVQGPDRTLMLARGPGADPDAPIKFLVSPLEHQVSRVAAGVEKVARAVGLGEGIRSLTKSINAHKSYGEKAARAVADLGADVAHIYIYDRLVPLVAEASPETKIVLHMHDHAQRRDDRQQVAENLERCDLIVGCSTYLARETSKRFPEFADRITAIPNSIPNMMAPADIEHRRDIVFTGRLSPEKGVHVLIKAFESIAHDHPDTDLVLIGPSSVPGPEVFETHREDAIFEETRDLIEARASGYASHLRSLISPEIEGRIHFRGEIPNDDVMSLIRSAAVLALPSIWQEPFGLPALEASAVGVPAVVTRSGALPEIVDDGITGLVAERNNVTELADAFSALLSDPVRAREMGLAGARRARAEFGWSDYVDTWRRTYHSLTD